MTKTITLETDKINGVCDFHDCEHESAYLWRVVDIEHMDEKVRVNHDLAEYCEMHSQTWAENEQNLHYIGSFK